jgi:cytochrome P450
MTLLPVIIEKATPYLNVLDDFSKTGEEFPLDQPTTNVTFDVIGAVTMGEDMNAQNFASSGQDQLINMFKEMIKSMHSTEHLVSVTTNVEAAYVDDKLQAPWWLAPRVHLKRHRLGTRISRSLRQIVRRNFDEMRSDDNGKASADTTRTILALSLQEIESLTPQIMEETCDQLKTFLFAGHDTTSTTIIWSIYELFRTPHALKAVRDELDTLFGPGTGVRGSASVHEKLLAPDGGELIHRMTYISAVIKEVLRLHPPAGSIRISKPGTGFVVTTPHGDYNLDGNWIYLNHNIIHRDRAVFGETADDFVPERWLQSEGTVCPPSAWRPFERGPRSCIGMELANIEARIIISMLVRRYEFIKVGLGQTELDVGGQPVVDGKGRLKVKSELYDVGIRSLYAIRRTFQILILILQTIRITGKPVDGMMMKVERLGV